MDESGLHSAEYFGEQRNFWWNEDFLALMGKRWELSSKKKTLDVGCGVGHWHRLLCPYLAKDAHITGIDQEEVWINKAQLFTEQFSKNAEQKFTFLNGDACSLPFSDNSFDFVTAQTVLIHMKDPRAALKEWLRVLRPGGLIGLSEPNNMAATTVRSSIDFFNPIPELISNIEFMMTCERGKWNLGEGHNSIGDLVPGYFAELGLEKIQVYIGDKPSPTFPKYDTPAEKAMIEGARDWDQRHYGPWSDMETKKYYIAGGGDPEAFDALRSNWLKNQSEYLAAIDEGKYYSSGGSMGYLISGIKPKD